MAQRSAPRNDNFSRCCCCGRVLPPSAHAMTALTPQQRALYMAILVRPRTVDSLKEVLWGQQQRDIATADKHIHVVINRLNARLSLHGLRVRSISGMYHLTDMTNGNTVKQRPGNPDAGRVDVGPQSAGSAGEHRRL